jgi:hypothetical protein
MCLENLDIILILKVSGSILSGFGSIILAWRISTIVKWVVYSIIAHEESINQLSTIICSNTQTAPLVQGVPKHLLDIQDKLGTIILVIGFILLGVGLLANALSFIFNAH